MTTRGEGAPTVTRRGLLGGAGSALVLLATGGCAKLLNSGADPTDPEKLVEDGAVFNYDLLLPAELREASPHAAELARTILEVRRKAAFLLGQGALDAVNGRRELVGGFTALRANPYIGGAGLDAKGFGVVKTHPKSIAYDDPNVDSWWTTIVNLVPEVGNPELQLDMVMGIAQNGRKPGDIRDVSGSIITLGRLNTSQGEYWSLTAEPASSDVPTGWPTSELTEPAFTIGQLERVAAMDTAKLELLLANGPMFK